MNPNELLASIERARMSSYFHKDWLLQIRAALRPQLPPEYHLFVESEAILIAPDDGEVEATTLPDVSVARPIGGERGPAAAAMEPGTAAILEVDEPFEIASRYSLVVRRSPDNLVSAVCEIVSPSNRGIGNRLDREQHLRKRTQLPRRASTCSRSTR